MRSDRYFHCAVSVERGKKKEVCVVSVGAASMTPEHNTATTTASVALGGGARRRSAISALVVALCILAYLAGESNRMQPHRSAVTLRTTSRRKVNDAGTAAMGGSWWFCLCHDNMMTLRRDMDANTSVGVDVVGGVHICTMEELEDDNRLRRRDHHRLRPRGVSSGRQLPCVLSNVCLERMPNNDEPYMWRGSAAAAIWKERTRDLRMRRGSVKPHHQATTSSTRMVVYPQNSSSPSVERDGNATGTPTLLSNHIRLHYFQRQGDGDRFPLSLPSLNWMTEDTSMEMLSDAVSDALQVVIPVKHASGADAREPKSWRRGRLRSAWLGALELSLRRNDSSMAFAAWSNFLSKEANRVLSMERNSGHSKDSLDDDLVADEFAGSGRDALSLFGLLPYNSFAYFAVTGLLDRVYPVLRDAFLVGQPAVSVPPAMSMEQQDALLRHTLVMDWFAHEDVAGRREHQESHTAASTTPLPVRRSSAQRPALGMPHAFNVLRWRRGRRNGAAGAASRGRDMICFDHPVVMGSADDGDAMMMRMEARAYVLRQLFRQPQPSAVPEAVLHDALRQRSYLTEDAKVCRHPSAGRLLYIKRSCNRGAAGDVAGGGRCIRDGDAFEGYLKTVLGGQHGLAITIAEFDASTPMEAQIRLAAHTDLLLGPHGSGLIHAVWMPNPCAHLVELFASRERYAADAFWYRDLLQQYGVPAQNHLVWWPPESNHTSTSQAHLQRRRNFSATAELASSSTPVQRRSMMRRAQAKHEDFLIRDVNVFHSALVAHLSRDTRWKRFFPPLSSKEHTTV
jgi:hypothetical protein